MGKPDNNKKQESSSNIKTDNYRLILLNDDDNDFDYVIRSLVEACGFDYEKAEQCTLLAHLKGAYRILSGEREKIEKIQNYLNTKNIHTKIEKQ
ncbi:MAG: ATP-dependent Clp protease adaptor ClpS [Bacteroidia bacterium]|nr:ATP-dependent Clp protease adaptor ClpS [Bacteroidia bacterium]